MSILIDEIKRARLVGVPLAIVNTSDDFASLKDIAENLSAKTPIIAWDMVRGYQSVNESGKPVVEKLILFKDPGSFDPNPPMIPIPAMLLQPVDALNVLLDEKKWTMVESDEGSFDPAKIVVCILGAQRILKEVAVEQAIANLRDIFKQSGKLLILLTAQGTTIPPSLSQDLFQIDDGVPNDEAREKIINSTLNDARAELEKIGVTIDADATKTSLQSTRGLSAYATEQSVSLSISPDKGFEPEILRKRWTQTINSVAGLTVDMSGMRPEDIGGLDPFKEFARRIMTGKNPPNAVIRIEEIEKSIAGAGYANGGVGDTSGTSQEILGAMLTFMEEEQCSGTIAIGPAGSGKSLSSVALGAYGGVPTITLDLSALKGSLVGETGERTKRALSIIKALAGKNTFWIASCNSAAAIPPELQRRFTFGQWFFDLPNAAERAKIWEIWLKKYPNVKDVRPDDEGWTGAEIRNACDIANRLDSEIDPFTPKDAGENYIVPISKTYAEKITALRQSASGKYLSANNGGVYVYNADAFKTASAITKPIKKSSQFSGLSKKEE